MSAVHSSHIVQQNGGFTAFLSIYSMKIPLKPTLFFGFLAIIYKKMIVPQTQNILNFDVDEF